VAEDGVPHPGTDAADGVDDGIRGDIFTVPRNGMSPTTFIRNALTMKTAIEIAGRLDLNRRTGAMKAMIRLVAL